MPPDQILPAPDALPAPVREIRNVYACLVHEQPDCILDLVLNLRHNDPVSPIILYNGGKHPDLLAGADVWQRLGAVVHPAPSPMKWGYLHGFALDCMRLALDLFTFDTLTIVDSDQAALKPGYRDRLAQAVEAWPAAGVFGDITGPHSRQTTVQAVQRFWKEYELWKPFLRRFPGGEDACVYSLFWPSTVFTAAAARDLCDLWDAEPALRDAFARTNAWATEEILLPTLVAILGHEVRPSPCGFEYVKFRRNFTLRQLDQALAKPDAFWMHPVPRKMAHPLRAGLRARLNGYGEGAAAVNTTARQTPRAAGRPLLLVSDILRRRHPISGWLTDEETDLLVAGVSRALEQGPGPQAVVEVGCYRGRGTVVLASVVQALSPTARVHAIDPHDGIVGATDGQLQATGPTLATFQRNIAAAGVADVVETIVGKAPTIRWDQPVSFLLVDGLHDQASVAADFNTFKPWLRPGSLVAFHDYAPYYPGVIRFVDEVLRQPGYRPVALRGSLMLIECLGPADPASRQPTP
ncbi:class I SAM-dependent methyltransferase [Nitrospirillum iridis]|uniref:Putative O-methyltransferase YrrM n=1 Tax=Nitrospirillum iridis TaxID=765888 RepID=A0A7X0AW24_9PROT|nr:class I SAM-dependent methyltransferase [Nitrospirillum iridis]MBB6250757.1 putative O-methyltransferase YrrM [Nitrospirillum iridis]